MNKAVQKAAEAQLAELTRGVMQGLVEYEWAENVPEEYAQAVAEYAELMDIVTGGLWSVQLELNRAHDRAEAAA